MATSFFRHHQAWLRWIPALLLAIAIFEFSSTPGDEVEESYRSFEATIQVVATPTPLPADPVPTISAPVPARRVTTAPILPMIDLLKVGHGIGYFWLGIAVLYGLSARSRWSPSLALILSCLYAASDEFHQVFVPGRTASARDILIDTLAALFGVAVVLGVMASKTYFSRNRK